MLKGPGENTDVWAGFSQKMRNLVIFIRGWVPFLLEIKQKAGQLVGKCKSWTLDSWTGFWTEIWTGFWTDT